MSWGSRPCKTGCFNKYQILGIAISTCIYQFIVQSYHKPFFRAHMANVKRMLLFYKLCFPENLYF